jgi:antitoxin component YwqK of YwqJK toxin-antitoxin module
MTNIPSSRPFSTPPPGALSEINQYQMPGVYDSVDYYINDELVWRRTYETDGRLIHEQGYRDGLAHGVSRDWHDNGILSHETYFLYGREHGTSQQYNDSGQLIGTYTMVHGTGLDRWYQQHDGYPVALAEERQYQNGYRHGFERWYWEPSSDGAIWQEKHFKEDTEHGIFREWSTNGRLRRGFPQYFVNGEKVSKRRYLTACKHDPSLPPFRLDDNNFHRDPLLP